MLIADLGRYTLEPEYQTREVAVQTGGVAMARRLYAEGKVKPHISETVPFEAKAVEKAIEDSTKGTGGKTVVKVQ